MSINIKKKALNVKNGDTYDNFDMFFLGDVGEAVDDWFEEHPDAVTNVADNSITAAKLAPSVREEVESVTDLKSALTELQGNTIPLPSYTNGYYMGNKNEQISYTPNNSSFAYEIDCTNYIGFSIVVHFDTTSTSARETCLCDANDIISVWYREKDIDNNGFKFNITATNYKLYISVSDLASNLRIDVLNGSVPILQNQVTTLNNATYSCYVDGTNGNDNNDGTIEHPYKTITKGINSGRKQIFIKPGTYSERVNLYNLSNMSLSPYGLPEFSVSNYEQKIVLDGVGTRPFCVYMTNCNNIKLEGFKATDWVNSGFRLVGCSDVQIFDCESDGAGNSSANRIGFELINSSGRIVNSIAHDMSLDGFNFHGYGATEVINCTAYNCGDDGISHHDACTGIIDGGEYYNCGKGGVTSPSYGAYINVYNAFCHDNLYGIYIAQDTNYRDCKSILSNNLMVNNSRYDLYVREGVVTGYNNIYTTKNIGSDATYTEYPNLLI